MKEILLEKYVYKDGNLYRKKGGGGQGKNTLVGWVTECNKRSYRKMSVNRKTIYVHQAVFIMHHGYLPKYIDHKDGDSLNNRIENLREATQSQNCANQRIKKTNTSGYKGVRFRKDTKKWNASITVNKKSISLGCFDLPEQAFKAYEAGAKKYFGDYARMEVKTTE